MEDSGTRSGGNGTGLEAIGRGSFQFSDEIQPFTSVPLLETGGSSFKALLELPPTQAMELLQHSTVSDQVVVPDGTCGEFFDDKLNQRPYVQRFDCSPAFLCKGELLQRLSTIGGGVNGSDGGGSGEKLGETMSSIPSNSCKVKNEPNDADSILNSYSPLISDHMADKKIQRNLKRKELEKRVKGQNKKCKSSGNESSVDAEQLPYVYVRARRGQATDSHSLAERARREKINARMKLLQELVPGCNKISGTALVLDEIINHVQSLQHQVESLSMRLAAVYPIDDINLESLLAAESGSLMNCNFPSTFVPMIWPPECQIIADRDQDHQSWQIDGYHQQPNWARDEGNHSFLTPDNSLLSYDSSANSVSLHSNQLKMEN